MESGALLLGDIYSLSGATCHAPGDGWGSYLAFTVDDASVEIARAALTGMPIYWTRFEDGFLLWNDLELVAPMLGIGSFDWQFIAGTLAYANLRTERTGLEGVSELLPGSCAKFLAEESAVQTLWTPWKAVSQPDLRPVAELALDLERRFLGCLRGWCGNRSDILLELSGGLDSSIVAAGLSSAQANFSAVTFVSSGADGDERPYARAVAAHCGAELLEMPHADTGIDLVSLPPVLHARPSAYGVLGGIDDAFESAFPVSDAAIFGGIGGDNIFDFDTSVAPILDAFRHFGPRRPAFETMRDVARAGDATVWQAARLAYPRRCRRPLSHLASVPAGGTRAAAWHRHCSRLRTSGPGLWHWRCPCDGIPGGDPAPSCWTAPLRARRIDIAASLCRNALPPPGGGRRLLWHDGDRAALRYGGHAGGDPAYARCRRRRRGGGPGT